MKILIINESFSEEQKSGANVVAFNNYYLLQEKNIDCYFFANGYKPYLEKQEINNLFPKAHCNKNGIINKFLYRLNSIYNFEAKSKLDKVIRELQPDIIHIHGIMELSFSIILSIKKYNIPYVLTVHDTSFLCPAGVTVTNNCSRCSKNIFNCIKNKCSKKSYLCSFYMAIKFLISRLIIKNYLPHQILTPSIALKEYIEECNASYNLPIKVIQNVLDEAFENVTPNYKNDGYFLFVGNLSDNKGVSNLLMAIKELPLAIKFHIVGTGHKENEYKEYVKDNNLKNVNFIGTLNRQELIKEYQNCIATIVPSTCFEVFGMINIESLINGKPVIGSNIGGIPEIVEHNVDGLIFEPANVEQLKECILTYWNNPELVIEHGKNGYNKVQKYYLKNNCSQYLLEIYEKIKKGNGDIL